MTRIARHASPRGRIRALCRGRLPAAGALLCLCGLAAVGCGDTLQTKPISHSTLESMVVAPFPVYWLGERYAGMQVTEADMDPSGSFTVQYGNCLQGGQGTCTPPLRLVTSPDNSFVPGGDSSRTLAAVRGVTAAVTDAGRTISIPTGGVVVSVYASDAAGARAAAGAIAPINRPEGPGERLPAQLPDTGFGSRPLPSQLPSTVRPLG
jgi:hypothetical protein